MTTHAQHVFCPSTFPQAPCKDVSRSEPVSPFGSVSYSGLLVG